MISLLKVLSLTGGEWVIYILLICSVGAVAVIIERAIILSREKKELEKVKPVILKNLENGKFENAIKECEGFEGLASRVLCSGLAQSAQGPAVAEDYLTLTAGHERKRLELRLLILGTLGNNAVYIGLFGTVLGVIKAFHDLAQEGSAGPEVVMQGLSEALIATAVGLLVALPCVIAYNIFQKQIKDLLIETDSMSRILLAKLKSKSS